MPDTYRPPFTLAYTRQYHGMTDTQTAPPAEIATRAASHMEILNPSKPHTLYCQEHGQRFTREPIGSIYWTVTYTPTPADQEQPAAEDEVPRQEDDEPAALYGCRVFRYLLAAGAPHHTHTNTDLELADTAGACMATAPLSEQTRATISSARHMIASYLRIRRQLDAQAPTSPARTPDEPPTSGGQPATLIAPPRTNPPAPSYAQPTPPPTKAPTPAWDF